MGINARKIQHTVEFYVPGWNEVRGAERVNQVIAALVPISGWVTTWDAVGMSATETLPTTIVRAHADQVFLKDCTRIARELSVKWDCDAVMFMYDGAAYMVAGGGAELTASIEDYRPVIAGDGHTAGHARRRIEIDGRSWWECRVVGAATWTGRYAELEDAEAACFVKEVPA